MDLFQVRGQHWTVIWPWRSTRDSNYFDAAADSKIHAFMAIFNCNLQYEATPVTTIMTPPSPSAHIASNQIPWKSTELVFINSSPGLKVGPNPRVIKRRNNYYMRPRSPPSPTTSRLEIPRSSGSLAARLKDDFMTTPGKTLWIRTYYNNSWLIYPSVSELEVEPFQLLSSFQGQKSVPRKLFYESRWKICSLYQPILISRKHHERTEGTHFRSLGRSHFILFPAA